MTQTPGEQIQVIYSARSTGRTMVVGPVTKTNYGYRKRGDVFMVYEADMRVRPDLFRSMSKVKTPQTVEPSPRKMRTAPRPIAPLRPAPQTPPPPQLIKKPESKPDNAILLANQEWDKVNKHHLNILAKAGYTTTDHIRSASEEELLKIRGIGDVIVRELKTRIR